MGSAFALVLHTHLPMVLNHGRWPHGSDWLCEAAFECYLPLLETAHRLVADGISPKWTINLSPILSEQLASPEFQKELSFYYENVRRACVESRAHFEAGGNKEIVRLTSFWEEFYERMWEMHRRIGGDIPGTFAELQRGGHVEMITCAATHGYLPLLGRDESIHLQLRTAVETHRRHFSQMPRGAWPKWRRCVSTALRVDAADRARQRPRSVGPGRHRGVARRARARVLRRGRAPRVGRRARLPLPRLRAAQGEARRARLVGAQHRGALTLRALSRRVAWRHRGGDRLLLRPEDHPPGLEPRARLSGGLRVPRVPQEALPRRAALLAHHGQLRRPRPQDRLRPRARRAEGGPPGPPLRRARDVHARHGRRRRAGRRLLALRRRALRPLVVRGPALARAGHPRDGAGRRRDAGDAR